LIGAIVLGSATGAPVTDAGAGPVDEARVGEQAVVPDTSRVQRAPIPMRAALKRLDIDESTWGKIKELFR
jgi:hypothetical protein